MDELKIGDYYNFLMQVGDADNQPIRTHDLLRITHLSTRQKTLRHSPAPVVEYRIVFHNVTQGRTNTITVGEHYPTILRYNHVEGQRRRLEALLYTIQN